MFCCRRELECWQGASDGIVDIVGVDAFTVQTLQLSSGRLVNGGC